jgi:DNA (cytosine-5)-methyltransferase 1
MRTWRGGACPRLLRMVDICAGIGGASLAAEWTGGIEIAGQVERDPFCRAVLAHHWPDVPRIKQMEDFRGDEFGHVDICIASIPCQPFSNAGKKRGAADSRNLWPDLRRILAAGCERGAPYRWLIIENVRGLLSTRGPDGDKGGFFKAILAALTDLGYRAGWCCYGAHTVGAPQRRERVFVMAYSNSGGLAERRDDAILGRSLSAHARQDRHRYPDARAAMRTESAREGPAQSRLGGSTSRLPARLDGYLWPARPGEPQHTWEPGRLLAPGVKLPDYRARMTALGNTLIPQQIFPLLMAIIHSEEVQRYELV